MRYAAKEYKVLIVDLEGEVQGTDDDDIIEAAEASGDFVLVYTNQVVDEASRDDWPLDEDEDEGNDEEEDEE